MAVPAITELLFNHEFQAADATSSGAGVGQQDVGDGKGIACVGQRERRELGGDLVVAVKLLVTFHAGAHGGAELPDETGYGVGGADRV